MAFDVALNDQFKYLYMKKSTASLTEEVRSQIQAGKESEDINTNLNENKYTARIKPIHTVLTG